MLQISTPESDSASHNSVVHALNIIKLHSPHVSLHDFTTGRSCLTFLMWRPHENVHNSLCRAAVESTKVMLLMKLFSSSFLGRLHLLIIYVELRIWL